MSANELLRMPLPVHETVGPRDVPHTTLDEFLQLARWEGAFLAAISAKDSEIAEQQAQIDDLRENPYDGVDGKLLSSEASAKHTARELRVSRHERAILQEFLDGILERLGEITPTLLGQPQ